MNREQNNIRICFIINPISGGREKTFLCNRLRKEFASDKYSIKIFFSDYPGHASLISREQIDEGTDIMAAVGGDGTINEVAKTLIDSDIPLAIIPFGSGNGFARHFRFPLHISKAIKVIKSGYVDIIDVGLVNDSPFFCTSGLGFDAETGYQFSHFGERGFFSYVFSLFRVFRKYNSCNYDIFFNNRSIRREAYFINIANISQYGYNFKIAPRARTNDGYLDLVIIKKFPKWKAVRLVLLFFTGNIHKSQFVEFHKADEIKIETDSESNKIHIDGEPGEGNGELVYKIKPKSLRVIIPSA